MQKVQYILSSVERKRIDFYSFYFFSSGECEEGEEQQDEEEDVDGDDTINFLLKGKTFATCEYSKCRL